MRHALRIRHTSADSLALPAATETVVFPIPQAQLQLHMYHQTLQRSHTGLDMSGTLATKRVQYFNHRSPITLYVFFYLAGLLALHGEDVLADE